MLSELLKNCKCFLKYSGNIHEKSQIMHNIYVSNTQFKNNWKSQNILLTIKE